MLIISILLVFSVDLSCADGLNPQSAPAAGDAITAEEPYTIRWEPGTDGLVSIALKWDNESFSSISDETQNNGSYTWTPSVSWAGYSDYFLAICDIIIENECTYTFDGRFSIFANSSSSSALPSSMVNVPEQYASTSSQFTIAMVLTNTGTPSISFTTATSSKSSHVSHASSTIATSTAASSNTRHRDGLSIDAKIAMAAVFGIVGSVGLGLGFFFAHRCWQRRDCGTDNAVGLGEKHRNEICEVDKRVELEGDPAQGIKVVPGGREGGQPWEGTGHRNNDSIYSRHDLPEWVG